MRMTGPSGWVERALALKTDLLALYLAARHPRTPWYAKLVVASLVVYAVTPVDFVPDLIPRLRIVDDLILVPLAIALAMRFVPAPVLAECRGRAQERLQTPRRSWLLLAALWLGLVAAGIAFYI